MNPGDIESRHVSTRSPAGGGLRERRAEPARTAFAREVTRPGLPEPARALRDATMSPWRQLSRAGKPWWPLALLSISGVVSGCNAQAEGKPAAPPAREVEVLTISPSEVRDTGEYLGSIVSRRA